MVSSKVLVIGQGYVGLPVAVRAVQVGHDVVGLDNDEQRVARLAAGDSFVEDVRSDELGQALASGRFAITTEQGAAEGFDVAVITVPTPLRDGLPDLTYIEIAARNLGPYVRPGALVVLESTTYPGTTEELMVPILEAGSGLKAGPDFHVAYSPERIDPGNQTWRFHNTPKVVGGIDADSLTRTPNTTTTRSRTTNMFGPLFESLVTLSARVYAQANEARVGHLRTHSGEHEIDLIIERPDGRVVALEIKLAANISDHDTRHLHWLQDRIGSDLLDAAIITTGTDAYRRSDGIAIIPAALLTT